MCYQRTCVVVFCLVSTSAGDVLSIVYPDCSTATKSAVSEKDEWLTFWYSNITMLIVLEIMHVCN